MKCVRFLGVVLLGAAIVSPAFSQLTVNVAAGGDVQGASLQVLQAGGGTINLAAGSYNINGPIVLGSNTTLNGAGGPGSAMQSVIYAPATPNSISMVTQAYAGASNLTISNLVLDGNIPQAAMLYGTGNNTAYANSPYNNNGIFIYDTNSTTVGVNLTNVEVRHTLRGILTGLVDNLTISGCYFHDNNPGGFSHNMYLVATSGVEIDHTRSNNALTGDGLHIDFGGQGYTIRKSEFSGNNGLGILSQQDNNVTVEDTRLDFNTNEGIQIDAGGLLLTRDTTNYNGGYGLQIPSTADGAGLVYGFYSIGNDPLNTGGDFGPNYVYQAAQVDYTESNPGPNTYPAIKADGVLGVADTGDMTLNYGYTYVGAVDFNANHLSNGAVTFQVGNAVATGAYPLNIRYSNGTSSNQTMNLSINGGAAVPVTFAPTGSYSTFGTVTTNQMLNVGNNAVTLSVPNGASSAPVLDILTVTAATPPVPNAPTHVQGVANGPYSVTLTWTPPANSNGNAAQTYNIYRNNTVPIVATGITGTTWTDTRIFYGVTTNQYFVTAVNQGGESGASNTVSVTTGIDAPPALQVSVKPSTPANNLNWLGVSGASVYLVKRSTVSGGPYQTVGTVSASINAANPSYSDTALSNGQTYYYVVVAQDANGNISANSYQVTAIAQTFTLSASASSVNLSSATPDTISVVGTNGFSDAVNFSVSGLPTGVMASFSTTSGSSTQITFTANTSATQGSYPVTVTGTDGGLSSSVAVTLAIGSGQLAQIITFNQIPPQAVGNSLAVYATASSGLPVTFSVVQNGNCSVSGNVVTFLNGGACGVLANQAGNANFSAAAQVGVLVQVGAPTAQTITFAAIATQNPGTSIPLTATASSGLAVSFASTTPGVCSVSGSTAVLLTGGTCTIVASQAGGGVYGPAKSVSQSFSVGQTQTITFLPPAAVTYGVAPIALGATASSGLAVSYSVSSGPGTLSGGSLTVTGAGTIVIVASQGGSSSYSSATPVTANIVVNPASLTVTADNLSRVVGATNPAFTYTATGFVNGDNSAIVSGTPSLTTTATATSAIGNYPITIAQGTLSAGSNYTLVFVNGTLQITAGGATTTTLAASPASATYGQTVTLNAKVLDASSSPVNGGTVSYSLYNAATNSATTFGSAPVNATTGVASLSATALPAGADTVIAVYNPASNYSASGNSAVVNISAAPITITVNAASKVDGAGVPTLAGTLGAAQNGDVLSVNYTTTATAASPVGNYPITAALTGAAAANYTVTVVPAVLSVSPATLTVTANSLSRAAGTANPTLTYTVTGYVNGDTGAILSGAPVLSTTATASSPTGPYAISIAQGTLSAGANYTLVLTPGTLTVTTASSQTITFATIPNTVYGAAPFTLSATASSGLPVTISVVQGNVALSGTTSALIGGTVTVLGAGPVTLQASQVGNGTYPAATSVQQSFNVAAVPLTATANAVSYVYGTSPPALTGSLSATVGTDSFTESYASNAPAVSPVPAGSYTITPSLVAVAPTLAANYSIAYNTAKMTVTQAGTTTTLGVLPTTVVQGMPVQLTATVLSNTSGTPTQTVNFYAGTTLLGAATLNGGVAILSTSSLPNGLQNVYAVYGGDSNFIVSQSVSQPISVVVPPGFSVTSAAPTLSIVAGQTGTMVISVASAGGYAKTVTASCGSGLPSGVVCSFSPASLTFTGQNNTLTTTLSVTTSLFARADTHRDGTAMAGVFWMAGLLGLWGISRRKLRGRLPGLICLLVLVGAGLSGCGSTNTFTATPGSYTVPLTVSDGTVTSSATVTVIIHQ
jgi:hypothetical protein